MVEFGLEVALRHGINELVLGDDILEDAQVEVKVEDALENPESAK